MDLTPHLARHPTARRSALVTAMTTTGLVAGLFFAFQTAVDPALARVGDREYVTTMQHVNRVIQNPVFLTVFGLVPVSLLAAIVLHLDRTGSVRVRLLVAATVVWLVGCVGVTAAGNIPLNDRLDAVPVATADVGALAAARAMYEQPWTRRHLVRTLAAAGAVALLAGALPAALIPPR